MPPVVPQRLPLAPQSMYPHNPYIVHVHPPPQSCDVPVPPDSGAIDDCTRHGAAWVVAIPPVGVVVLLLLPPPPPPLLLTRLLVLARRPASPAHYHHDDHHPEGGVVVDDTTAQRNRNYYCPSYSYSPLNYDVFVVVHYSLVIPMANDDDDDNDVVDADVDNDVGVVTVVVPFY